MRVGKIVRIIGPVIDAEFKPGELPRILNALKVTTQSGSGEIELIAEVQQHLGNDQVRAVAMSSTDGLVRGTEILDTGAPISIPVGKATLGRLFNLLGEGPGPDGSTVTCSAWTPSSRAP